MILFFTKTSALPLHDVKAVTRQAGFTYVDDFAFTEVSEEEHAAYLKELKACQDATIEYENTQRRLQILDLYWWHDFDNDECPINREGGICKCKKKDDLPIQEPK